MLFYVHQDYTEAVMKLIKWILLGLLGVSLYACSSLPGADRHADKLERVGILLVQNCGQRADCYPYSLLGQDIQNRTAILSGNIDASLKGRLIAVLGKELAPQNGMEAIEVEQTLAITDVDYQPFLAQAVATHTSQQFGCRSLWDQGYAWRLDGRQPILIAHLSHPKDPSKGLLLEFDGLSKALLSESALSDSVNPCE